MDDGLSVEVVMAWLKSSPDNDGAGFHASSRSIIFPPLPDNRAVLCWTVFVFHVYIFFPSSCRTSYRYTMTRYLFFMSHFLFFAPIFWIILILAICFLLFSSLLAQHIGLHMITSKTHRPLVARLTWVSLSTSFIFTFLNDTPTRNGILSFVIGWSWVCRYSLYLYTFVWSSSIMEADS